MRRIYDALSTLKAFSTRSVCQLDDIDRDHIQIKVYLYRCLLLYQSQNTVCARLFTIKFPFQDGYRLFQNNFSSSLFLILKDERLLLLIISTEIQHIELPAALVCDMLW